MPKAFGSLGLTFAVAYGVVRPAHIALFTLASRDDPALRHSVNGLAVSTAIGVTLLACASLLDGVAQGAIWALALDVAALVAARRLAATEPGRERNEMARDSYSYSYLHYLMIAGIVLAALGLEKTLEHVSDPLQTVPAFALLGGVALYLLGHVAFRYRHIHTVNWRRFGLAALLLALWPLAIEIPALATLAIVTALLWALIAYETRLYGENRHRLHHPEPAGASA